MAARIVIALGGNALGNNAEEQKEKIDGAVKSLVGLIAQGYEIIVTHGNGPQVGMINLAFAEGAEHNEKVPQMPLPECAAMSQGYIGYHLQQGILREMRRENMPWHVASMITQTVVDAADPAFDNPTKPIGAFYTEEQAKELQRLYPDRCYKEDAGRGYRQLVPSPRPLDIVEKDSILNLLDNEFVVIAAGGGGIPVIRRADGDLQGVEAVIDKDLAAAALAELTQAEYLFILTAVERVAINYGKPDQAFLEKMSVSEAERYCAEGHFAPGSMLPKVQAAINFAKSKKGRKAIIADLRYAPQAIRGESGTKIYMD